MLRRNVLGWLTVPTLAVMLASGPAGAHIARAAGPGAPHLQAGSSLHLLNPGYLTVGSDTTYPPQESIVNGKAVGADIDLANAMAKAMGLKGAKIVSNDFNSIIPAMTIRHRFDVIMSSMTDNADRRKLVNFVDYMVSAEAILVRSGSPIHGNSYASVCGHSIAVESGTTEYDELTAQAKKCSISIKTYTHDTDAYQAFVSRHTDSYTGDYPVVVLYVKQSSGSFKMAGKAFSSGEKYGIAMTKGATTLRSAINKALQKIRTSGQYRQILKKWGLASAAI
jgi:polar amino acid transport system substrate-binding protein